MEEPVVVDVSEYQQKYALKESRVVLTKIPWPEIDINSPGLILHGSEADPVNIIKYGLVPQQIIGQVDSDWQICLGLNSKDLNSTLEKDQSRKNNAVQYCGYFSEKGVLYVVNDEVKTFSSYREFWDGGENATGVAWVSEPIPSKYIEAVISDNLNLVTAAMASAQQRMPIYTPDGSGYWI